MTNPRPEPESNSVNPFLFDSVIYNGFDIPQDGIGNHLGLFDRLIFNDLPQERKSLTSIYADTSIQAYGRVVEDLHLRYPDRFKNCLFLDVARDTWDPDEIRSQMRKTIDHKKIFNAVTAIYLMWESDTLWDLYGELIACYDFCIVTSSILDEDLQRRGVDFVKLRHPYDFERSDENNSPSPDKFRFGVSAGLWRRKNVTLLAQEFLHAFRKDSEVELSIHTRSDVSQRDFSEEYLNLERLRERCYRIELICKSMTRPEYYEWMRTLDAYCFLSSGEGYSVTPREALHLGIPVVLLDAHVHEEFSHLPGVVRVSSGGKKEAMANTRMGIYDIGSDWQVDRADLSRALLYCREHAKELRQNLADSYDQVLQLHSLADIKKDWVQALNRKYTEHSNAIRLEYPLPGGTQLQTLPAIPGNLRLSAPNLQVETGHLIRDRVVCFKDQHELGYCLYGPGSQMARSGKLRVNVQIDIFSVPRENDAEIVRLDVHTWSRTLLTHITRRKDVKRLENTIEVDVDVEAGETIDLAVFWFGTSDICLWGISTMWIDQPALAS